MENKLIILRGVPGSGKSFLAKKVKEEYKEYNPKSFSTDEFFFDKNNNYVFDGAKTGIAHSWNHNRIEKAMKEKESVIIVDNTNVTLKDMFPLVDLAEKYNYKIEYRQPDWNEELFDKNGKWNVRFLEEIQNKPDRDKKISRDVIERMVNKYVYKNKNESDEDFTKRIKEHKFKQKLT